MATALEPRPRPFTVEEYLRMGESGILLPDERVELIEGEIIQMAPIGSPHAGTVAHLLTLLVRGAGERAVVWPQNPLHLGDRSMPQPDLIGERICPQALPDLVIEVGALLAAEAGV
jgi:Uma2 family endonuclease